MPDRFDTLAGRHRIFTIRALSAMIPGRMSRTWRSFATYFTFRERQFEHVSRYALASLCFERFALGVELDDAGMTTMMRIVLIH